MSESPLTAIQPDPELEALPKPRRPWRRLTLGVMAVTALASLFVVQQLKPQVLYALTGNTPRDAGEAAQFTPESSWANAWVRTHAELESDAVRYRRPLEKDSFRVARVRGNPQLWVQLRVPSDIEDGVYIPPDSFVGHLMPFAQTGLPYADLSDSIQSAQGQAPGAEDWLLIDGEAPRGLRWVFGVVPLLVGFALFNLWGIYQIVRAPKAA